MPRKHYIAITVDYETWQPIPEGKAIDWERDIIENTDLLMDAAEKAGVRLTLMAELGEYYWLLEYRPLIAARIRRQLRDAVRRGHDVQLHLHPNWLPELGARQEDGDWHWDWAVAAAADYPGDLSELLGRCKEELETCLRTVKEDYRVVAFRAGAYRVQPFESLYDALVKNQISCDTSVYKGGNSSDRGYNFKRCRSFSRPYFSDRRDPQIERRGGGVIEIPITTWKKGQRWFFDSDECVRLAKRFLELKSCYFKNEANFFLMIGHSKGRHDYRELARNWELLGRYPDVEFVTLSEMVDLAENWLGRSMPAAARSLEEVCGIMNFIYRTIEPGSMQGENKVEAVLVERKTLCLGYNLLLCQILRQYGYRVRPVTLYVGDMPKGVGAERIDTHEVLALRLNGKHYVLDATTNRIFPHSVRELLKSPAKADGRETMDERYVSNHYGWYDTGFFYERVTKYRIGDYYLTSEPGEGRKRKLCRLAGNFIHSTIPRSMWFRNPRGQRR